MAAVDARREAAVRRWRAAIIATLVMQLSYQPLTLIRAAFRGADIEPGLVGNALAFGLGAMPVVLMTAVFISRHLSATSAVLKGMGLFIVLGLPLYLVVDPIVGATAGYAAAAVVTLRQDFGPYATQMRVVTAIGIVVATLLLVTVLDAASAVIGATLPFLAAAYVDHRVSQRFPPEEDDEEALLEE